MTGPHTDALPPSPFPGEAAVPDFDPLYPDWEVVETARLRVLHELQGLGVDPEAVLLAGYDPGIPKAAGGEFATGEDRHDFFFGTVGSLRPPAASDDEELAGERWVVNPLQYALQPGHRLGVYSKDRLQPHLKEADEEFGTYIAEATAAEVEAAKVTDIDLATTIPHHLTYLPEGKLRLGLSVYGLSVKPKQIMGTGLSLKKVIRQSGRSLRLIPNTEPALNTAQVLHNQLTKSLGWELIFVRDGDKTLLAQTIAAQDIESYTLRDRGRPKRDAKVGMLPPKLAQIIINLAVGLVDPVDPKCGPGIKFDQTILDPFCGTGVILQEALLMGYKAYGTDLERRMFEYSQVNLEWLIDRFRPAQTDFRVSIGDATQNDWVEPIDIVAAETYLGRPFSSLPAPEVLGGVIRDVDTIHKKFFNNLAKQLKSGTRLCIAVPAWKTKDGFKHLPTLDHLTDLGYTRLSFVHADNSDLIYHRPGQVVARELVVLKRK